MAYVANPIADPSERGFTDYDSERLKKVVNGVNANLESIASEIADHNHAGDYADREHEHDGDYSGIEHNHDGAYCAIGHVHDDLLVSERTLPDAPASDKAIIFLVDSDGSSELRVRFSNGVVKTLATDVAQ